MAFLDLPEGTPEWHAHRLNYINASEIAALFGEEDKPDDGFVEHHEDVKAGFSDSMFSLHYIKGGAVKPREAANDLVDAGIFMEPSIASFAAHKRGWKIEKGQRAVDDTTPGMAASLDYVIVDAGKDVGGVEADGRQIMRGIGPVVGRGVLQIKNVQERQYRKKWTDGEPPPYVVLQVQQEIACAGFKWGVLAAWVGGNRLVLYYYEAHAGMIAMIRERITAFWKRVADKVPPAADGSDASNHALRQLIPVKVPNDNAPLDLTGHNELPVLCAELTKITPDRLDLEKREKDIKAQIEQIMGTATFGVTQGWQVSCSVTPANPGRPPRPGELIGKKREVRKYSVKERIA